MPLITGDWVLYATAQVSFSHDWGQTIFNSVIFAPSFLINNTNKQNRRTLLASSKN